MSKKQKGFWGKNTKRRTKLENDMGLQKEKFSSESTIKGSFIFDEEYPGCPHCGAQSFFTCGKCGKITCWDGSDTATCALCGNKSKIQLVNELEVKGGGFQIILISER